MDRKKNISKKASAISLIFFFVVTSIIIVPSPIADMSEIIDDLYPGEYEIQEDNGNHSITFFDVAYTLLNSPGDPLLPERIVEYEVSPNINWSTVKLTYQIQESEILNGTYNISSCPPEIAVISGETEEENIEITLWGPDKKIVNKTNIQTYNNDSYYPENTVELLPYSERKVAVAGTPEYIGKFLRIAYRPFLYNPVSKQLQLIKHVQIKITYETTPMIKSFDRKASYDYVIITTNDIVANSDRLHHFIHLKEIYGHNVLVVTEDDYDSLVGQYPNDRADRIRKWLRLNYDGYGIDYVLLIGDPDADDPTTPSDDVGDVPMKHCYTFYHEWRYRDCPTDWYYADLNGNWDLDGDGIYGELLDVDRPLSPEWPIISTDYFSILWKGSVHCDYTENYIFRTLSDGGVRVYLDGNLVIDNWDTYSEHAPTVDETTIHMTAGDHDIRVEYKEHTGDGIIRLYWQTDVPKSHPNYVSPKIIPLDHLQNETGASQGLTAEFYNNIYFTGSPALIRPHGEIVNGIWATGDYGPGGAETGADVYVGRIPVYDDDYAQLDEILDKIITYETTPSSDVGWRYSALLPMKPMDSKVTSHQLGEKIKNDICIPLGMSFHRIYEEDYGVGPETIPCTYNNVRNEWNKSYGLVAWATHGNVNNACSIYLSKFAPELDNSKPAFTAQASCLTAYPERKDNLAYSLLKNGAIAAVGGTRITFYGGEWEVYNPDDDRYPQFVYFYVNGLTNGNLPAGVSLAEEKKPIAYASQNVLAFMLYGDPETYFFHTIPNLFPVAQTTGPYIGFEGDTITLNASGSYDPEGDTLEYRWDVDNDGDWDQNWTTKPTYHYTYLDDFMGQARLEVRDQLGKTDTETAFVVIHNVDPVVTILSPNGGENWSGTHNIIWNVSDEGILDTFTTDIVYSSDNGIHWVDVATDIITIQGENSFAWNTTQFNESAKALISIEVIDDDGGDDTDQSDDTFIVDNTPPVTNKTFTGETYGPDDLFVSIPNTVDLDAYDALSGVAATYYRIWHDGTWTPAPGSGEGVHNNYQLYTNNFSFDHEGRYYLEFYSVDHADNIENLTNQTHIVYDWWPMYQHDVKNTGLSQSSIPDTSTVLWRTQLGAPVKSSPAVVYDSLLYIGCHTGTIYCLNATTGEQLWSFDTVYPVESSPLVMDDKVYVGSLDGMFYCLDYLTGMKQWSVQTMDSIVSSPIGDHDMVIVGSDQLYAFNASDGALLWSVDLGAKIRASPALFDDMVIGAGLNGRIVCVSSIDGLEIWSDDLYAPVQSSPTIIVDDVVMGCDNGDVYCYHAQTGNLRWTASTYGAVLSSPVEYDDSVVIASGDARLYQFDRGDGSLIWSAFIAPFTTSSPAIVDDRLIIGSLIAKIYCINLSSRTVEWSYQTYGGIYSSAAVFNSRVYIGSNDGNVFCFGSDHQGDQPTMLNPKADVGGPYKETHNIPVLFNATASTDQDEKGERIVQYDWKFEDEESWYDDLGPQPSYRYTSPGQYEVSVRVMDDEGIIDVDTTMVTIVNDTVKGDMNDDGILNSADVRYLALYLSGHPLYSPLYADGDVNSDGRINSGDIRYLALYLSGHPDYSPLYP